MNQLYAAPSRTPANSKGVTEMEKQNVSFYVPVNTGPAFWGPNDRYTFLVTGAQSDGAYFIMEADVPPGGGPPPHIHRREQESFYLLDGTLEIQMGDKTVQASKGDFVHIARGEVHCFRNTGSTTARLLLIFSPGGIEGFFEDSLERVQDRSEEQPKNWETVVARYIEAAPRYGLEFK
jgi:quercetin dioxygenase-like cupin family protein